MLRGFRDFITRGNVIDLAVAVVIGAAFTAVVNSIVGNLIDPLISLVFRADSLDKAMVWSINGSEFRFGAVIGAVISFLAVAVVVYFVFVLPMNVYRDRRAKAAAAEEVEDAGLTETELLTQIRDLLAETGSANSGGSGHPRH
ncbi:large conductance mechanosensitive channel protein MscL [Agromyces sp. Marseille-Q5079]|uniref:large conductance mechanosensitive channel protein MscL n=1 Tax=Agromyces sp. Marseille-Q5079 TaxID=3439059 RepID=UPI003D9C9F3F